MATASITSMKTKKLPKKPKMTASKKSWDTYESKKKAVMQHNQKVATEKARRLKIASK